MTITAAHSFPVWLPQTQTWLYQQVRSLPDDITSHIICKETLNEDQFNLPNIHSLSGPASKRSKITTRLFRHADYHLYTYRMCRKLGPGILHSHFGPVGWKNHKVLRLFNAHNVKQMKHIVTFYGQDVDHLPKVNPKWRSRYRDMFRHIDLVLCEGPFMAEKVVSLGCPENRVAVHRLGVDLDAIPYQPRSLEENEPVKILMAAAFRPKKGFQYGLKALEKLAGRFDFRITLVGDETGDEVSAEEKKKILKYTADSKLADRITLKGFITAGDLTRLALDHHIYLAPSLTADDGDSEGGAPVSLIEMAASGMPAVSSNHCDIPQVIKHGTNGLLSEERDADSLAQHLEYLIRHPEKWKEFGSKSRRHIESQFNASVQGQRLAEIYRNVIRGVSGPATVKKPGGTAKKPRLLFISHSGGLYGAERSLLELLTGLQRRKMYDLLVFLPEKSGLAAELESRGIGYRVIPYSRWIGSRYVRLAGFARSLNNRIQKKQMVREAEAWDPDLVYTNSLSTPVGAMMAAELSGLQKRTIPHIWHARELPGNPDFRFGLFDAGTRKAMNYIRASTGHIISNSRFLAGELDTMLKSTTGAARTNDSPKSDPELHSGPELHVVYNGFDYREFEDAAGVNFDRISQRTAGSSREAGSPADKSQKRPWKLVMAGGINEAKNHAEALEAVSILHKQGLQIALTIYGSGDRATVAKLKNHIRSMSLEEYVTLAGHKTSVNDIYSGADMLLVTSRIETFGRSAVEAMLSGCAVVSSDAGAMPEVVSDGETGLIYRSGDAASLAQQIKKLSEDPGYHERVVTNARKYAQQKFTAEAYVRDIEQVITSAVNV